ncbi:hypothetical protein MKSMC1_57650 [Mycobacterium kansasii]|nr:hypothetical protein MKSMC1_57650 [Mycobacterium kansasii]
MTADNTLPPAMSARFFRSLPQRCRRGPAAVRVREFFQPNSHVDDTLAIPLLARITI